MKESARQPQKFSQGVLDRAVQLNKQVSGGKECWAGPPNKIYRAFSIGQCSKADRLLEKESVGQPPPKKNLMAFWQGKCNWPGSLLVKESSGQPSPKNSWRSAKGNATEEIGYW